MNDNEMKKEVYEFKEKAKESMEKNKAGGYISRPERYNDMLVAYLGLKSIVDGKFLRIKYEYTKPYALIGYIYASGDDIKIKNPEMFSYIVDTATNFEIYPTVDNVIKFSFGFTDLVKEIE